MTFQPCADIDGVRAPLISTVMASAARVSVIVIKIILQLVWCVMQMGSYGHSEGNPAFSGSIEMLRLRRPKAGGSAQHDTIRSA